MHAQVEVNDLVGLVVSLDQQEGAIGSRKLSATAAEVGEAVGSMAVSVAMIAGASVEVAVDVPPQAERRSKKRRTVPIRSFFFIGWFTSEISELKFFFQQDLILDGDAILADHGD